MTGGTLRVRAAQLPGRPDLVDLEVRDGRFTSVAPHE